MCFNTWLCPKFAYEVPNQITPDQTKACITKWSCETPLFWDTTQRWEIILYRHFSTTCLSKIQGSRCTKQRTTNFTDTLFFFGTLVHHLFFLKKHNVSEAGPFPIFTERSTLLCEPLRLSHSQSLGTTGTVTC